MTNKSQAGIAMPKYRSHKEVSALKIASVEVKLPTIAELEEIIEGRDCVVVGGVLTPEDSQYAPFEVTQAYMHKHEPKAGGYYVIYGDGYASFSPAEAFESGYTQIRKGGA